MRWTGFFGQLKGLRRRRPWTAYPARETAGEDAPFSSIEIRLNNVGHKTLLTPNPVRPDSDESAAIFAYDAEHVTRRTNIRLSAERTVH